MLPGEWAAAARRIGEAVTRAEAAATAARIVAQGRGAGGTERRAREELQRAREILAEVGAKIGAP